ncbi:magnesium-translocating P-type ATPase [Massilia agilis]|uniref:Magnesium-transporting ATPase, P-type 1 n=1 Tax=Massilia agilis TaxID=1811226 RepID=A0ABT2D5Y4_9BURK|nr:magnesium-translocating P-type ATPase [Massilia agilis]MCS0806724.1 magnesium-translocating P-type ATPase [Massilia agilis]
MRAPEPPGPGHAAPVPALPELARLAPEAALAALSSARAGLTADESARRLGLYGPNAVAVAPRLGAALRFVHVLASPLSLLLLGLAILNLVSGQALPALVIAVIVVLSSLLTFVQEYRSDKAAAALAAMVRTTVTVLRPGPDGNAERHEEALASLAPGDLVQLSAGDSVPADLRLLESRDLFVSQAAFTGESMPVEKFAVPVDQPPDSLPDLPNIAFMGSTVLSGSATAVVAITGRHTSFGAIAAAAAGARELTDFDRGMDRFVQLMLRAMLVMMPLVFLVNGLDKGNWLEALLFAVAVAVGLTPELLPMVVTINLARGALDMAGQRMIVKRLNAIQNLGAMDVLCTDKTGTLTQDRVILERHVDIDGNDSQRVLEYAWLNSFHQTGLHNLLDLAVLEHAQVQHLRQGAGYVKVDELPFDFARRRMSVVLARPNGQRLLICKGAVEEVLAACRYVQRENDHQPLESAHGVVLADVVRRLNEDGMRVIAVAVRELPPGPHTLTTEDERDLVLAGYIAFLDPPKETAAAALRALEQAGIAIKVLTGDNDAVTYSVCRHVGLAVQAPVLGHDLDGITPAQLAARAEAGSVFAKVTPQQKADIIRALQDAGHVVGYLGDGINDSIALKSADVGISVDSGASIAKESADIIMLEKDLVALHRGVLEGRSVFGDIVKYLRMSASSNFGNMLSVVGASLLLPFLPMAPLQILLNNLLYDVSQTALASDRVDPDFLRQPRRWHTADIRRAMFVLGPVSSLFDYATFGLLWFVLGASSQPALFQTGWFVESLLSQTLVVHVIRTDQLPFVQSRPSNALLATTMLVCLLGLWLPSSPLAPVLGFVPLPTLYWLALPVLLMAYLALVQSVKGRSRLSAVALARPGPASAPGHSRLADRTGKLGL